MTCCFRRCAFNTSVQLVACLPLVKQYLQQLCKSCTKGLLLHKALLAQLEGIAAAGRAREVASLDSFMLALDRVPSLSHLTARDPRQALPLLHSFSQLSCGVSVMPALRQAFPLTSVPTLLMSVLQPSAFGACRSQRGVCRNHQRSA